MSQPAGMRYRSNPFRKPAREYGSKKLGINVDDIDFSDNHREADQDNRQALTVLRLELVRAEAEGKHSKAKKIRRAINKEMEQGLYLNHSFCGGCHNFLHNCKC